MTVRRRDEDGSALVELSWLGILLLVPMLWIVLSVFEVQRGAFAVSGAARAAGRAYALAPDRRRGQAARRGGRRARRSPTRASAARRSGCGSPARRTPTTATAAPRSSPSSSPRGSTCRCCRRSSAATPRASRSTRPTRVPIGQFQEVDRASRDERADDGPGHGADRRLRVRPRDGGRAGRRRRRRPTSSARASTPSPTAPPCAAPTSAPPAARSTPVGSPRGPARPDAPLRSAASVRDYLAELRRVCVVPRTVLHRRPRPAHVERHRPPARAARPAAHRPGLAGGRHDRRHRVGGGGRGAVSRGVR